MNGQLPNQNQPLECTAIIDHVVDLCDFLADSIMMNFIDQQQWSTLEHVVSLGFDDVGEFFTVRDDGITFDDTPMLIHLQRFKAFLLYYHNKTCCSEGPTVYVVMSWTPNDLIEYCSSKAYHDDFCYIQPFHSIKAITEI
jgi:hypothetical protein